MNMLIKKKEIAAAALVVLIGCAGYLNWSYQDTMKVRDGESYIETGRRLGEAQLVSNETQVEEGETTSDEAEETLPPVKDAEYFEQARYERDNARSQSTEMLEKTCSNQSFDEETRRKAGEKLIETADSARREQEIESIARSKGYDDICVYLNGSSAAVTVRKEGFDESDALRLTEIVQEQTDIDASGIRIVNTDR